MLSYLGIRQLRSYDVKSIYYVLNCPCFAQETEHSSDSVTQEKESSAQIGVCRSVGVVGCI